MSKVLGFNRKGSSHWFSSSAFEDKDIIAIKDPEGGSEVYLPSAIPSPFARIDLVKTAFRNIVKSPDLKSFKKEGNVIVSKEDEKLVSNTLDIAELLFNYKSLEKKLNVIVWNRREDLGWLKGESEFVTSDDNRDLDTINKHRRFAETLSLYLDQDKKAYNFEFLEKIYLVEFNQKIVGATSPATLFFATAANLSDFYIKLSGDYTLFKDYTPLYERDLDFQIFLHHLMKANDILDSKLEVIKEYLRINESILEKSKKVYKKVIDDKNKESDITLSKAIIDLKKSYFNSNYPELIPTDKKDKLELFGIPYRCNQTSRQNDIILNESNFVIQNTVDLNSDDYIPLALEEGNRLQGLAYTSKNDKWNSSIKIDVNSNTLPGRSISYPYLKIEELFEPILVKTIYKINNDCFFNGYAKNRQTDKYEQSDLEYLIPLKTELFKYFKTEDLLKLHNDGKPWLEIEASSSLSVNFYLRIPIRGGHYVEFKKTYEKHEEGKLNRSALQKHGSTIENQFGCTIFPFIKINLPLIKPDYRIHLVDRDHKGIFSNAVYRLKFYKNNSKGEISVEKDGVITRSKKTIGKAQTAQSTYYVLKENFDYFQVSIVFSNDNAEGIIIPKWNDYNGGENQFSFSVDFGTTNTHIEYSLNGDEANTFDILATESQVASFYNPDPQKHHKITDESAYAIQELIEQELIPFEIAPGKDYSFPHRTILSENEDLNLKASTHPLASFNIPFVYEKKTTKHIIIPELKWASLDDDNLKRIRSYFSNILLLLRSKVLYGKGRLNDTELIWFYPSSMSKGRKSLMNTMWTEEFTKYFNSENKPTGIVESLAPYYYHRKGKEFIGNSNPAISIDIGGGTTDIVVYHKRIPILLTSFRFAANAVFGDGFSAKGNAGSNGLVIKYVKKFDELLSVKNESSLLGVLAELNKKGKSSEINSFLFSVEKNAKPGNKTELSYNSMLSKDEDFKIVFIFFYVALVYQTARTLKFKNVPLTDEGLLLPTDLLFSGTGSKILNIITGDLAYLADLSKLIFEEVYQMKYGTSKLRIHTENNFPKEVTCKGGLLANKDELKVFDIKKIKVVINSNVNGLVDDLKVKEIDSKVENAIVKDVESFIELFKALSKQHNYNEHYIVSRRSTELFKEICKEHLLDYLQEGILNYNLNTEYDEDENELQESLFFYSIIGSIYNYLNLSTGFK